MQPSYVELHCISNFSFLRGASHPEELVERALALGYSGLAITDECSFAGAVRAHLALRALTPDPSPTGVGEGSGVRAHEFRLIHGTAIRLADGPNLVLLAQTRTGYGNLSELVTRARRAAPKGEYRLTAAELAAQAHLLEDSLALLVPQQAPRGQRQSGTDAESIERDACWLHQLLPGRSWIACELTRGPDDAAWLAALQEAGLRAGLPLAAAGAVHMHLRSRKKLQDALTAVRLRTPLAQCGRQLASNAERYLRPLYRLAASTRPNFWRRHWRSPSAAVSRSTSCDTSTRRKSSQAARHRLLFFAARPGGARPCATRRACRTRCAR